MGKSIELEGLAIMETSREVDVNGMETPCCEAIDEWKVITTIATM